MADLSPTARAIVAAFNDCYELCGPFDDNWQELCLAAALRVAVDAVVPEPPAWEIGVLASADREVEIRRDILVIAAELDSSNA